MPVDCSGLKPPARVPFALVCPRCQYVTLRSPIPFIHLQRYLSLSGTRITESMQGQLRSGQERKILVGLALAPLSLQPSIS